MATASELMGSIMDKYNAKHGTNLGQKTTPKPTTDTPLIQNTTQTLPNSAPQADNMSQLISILQGNSPDWENYYDDSSMVMDRNEMEQLMKDSISSAYDKRYAEQDRLDSNYYNTLSANADTLETAIRSDRMNAITNGVTKGMSKASELSRTLGFSQQSVDGATELAGLRAGIADSEAADLAGVGAASAEMINALGIDLNKLRVDYYNADTINNTALANLLSSGYASDKGKESQDYASQMAYLAQQEASKAQVDSAGISAAASRYNTDVNAATQNAYYNSLNPSGTGDDLLVNDYTALWYKYGEMGVDPDEIDALIQAQHPDVWAAYNNNQASTQPFFNIDALTGAQVKNDTNTTTTPLNRVAPYTNPVGKVYAPANSDTLGMGALIKLIQDRAWENAE